MFSLYTFSSILLLSMSLCLYMYYAQIISVFYFYADCKYFSFHYWSLYIYWNYLHICAWSTILLGTFYFPCFVFLLLIFHASFWIDWIYLFLKKNQFSPLLLWQFYTLLLSFYYLTLNCNVHPQHTKVYVNVYFPALYSHVCDVKDIIL